MVSARTPRAASSGVPSGRGGSVLQAFRTESCRAHDRKRDPPDATTSTAVGERIPARCLRVATGTPFYSGRLPTSNGRSHGERASP